MKIAVTAQGQDLDSELDPRFGRAAYFVLVDSETMEYEVIDNQENLNALKGAGIKSGQTLSDRGANLLITGYCGPNAFKTLDAAGIQVAMNASGTVREAVKSYLAGELKLADAANVEAQW